jgi:hypothetical protein
MLTRYENKTLGGIRNKLAGLRQQESALQDRRRQEQVTPIEKEISSTRAAIEKTAAELQEAEQKADQEYRADLVDRYNQARHALCDALIVAAKANAVVEEIEDEAYSRYSHGTNLGAPACFHQHSRSLPMLSLARRGRIVTWWRDLLHEAPSVRIPEIADILAELQQQDQQRESGVRIDAKREKERIRQGLDLVTHQVAMYGVDLTGVQRHENESLAEFRARRDRERDTQIAAAKLAEKKRGETFAAAFSR